MHCLLLVALIASLLVSTTDAFYLSGGSASYAQRSLGVSASSRAQRRHDRVTMGLFGLGAPKTAAPSSDTVAISFNGKSVNVAPGSPLSAAAAKAGVRVRYDCKEGKCGICQVKVNGKDMRTCVAKVPKTGGTVIVP